VSELRSAVESLRGEMLAELPDARVEEDFAEIRRIVDQLDWKRSGGWPRSSGAVSSGAMGTSRPPRG
jgi:hypothetical protein